MKKFKKQVKGITLIALVVTIIVLLILAGISINFVFGENGLIGRAQQAVSLTDEATAKEEMGLYLTGINIEN